MKRIPSPLGTLVRNPQVHELQPTKKQERPADGAS